MRLPKPFLFIVLFLLLFVSMYPSVIVNGDWFVKSISSDVDYIRIDEITGISSTNEFFTINVSSNVYIKVVGTEGLSPWLTQGSDWYFDLYLRPDTVSEWTLVKEHGKDTLPSGNIYVTKDVAAELKTVMYYPTDFNTGLSADVLPDGDLLPCVDIRNFPESGSVKIGDEIIRYASKAYDGSLREIVRGYDGTTPEYHKIGDRVSLYSGIFKIPIIIAINQTSGSSGSGGGMHPARSHVYKLTISVGKPPIASASVTKWYHMVTADASQSYDEDGTIVSYQWDWESDGIWDDSHMKTHYNYTIEGNFVIRLKVTDNDGMSDVFDIPVTIIFPPPKSFSLLSNFYGLPLFLWIIIGAFSIIVLPVIIIRSRNGNKNMYGSNKNFLKAKKRHKFY